MTQQHHQNHATWECKYHVVFIPKYRKKTIFGVIKKRLGDVFHELARRRESKIEEGHLMPDHVHMLISRARSCLAYRCLTEIVSHCRISLTADHVFNFRLTPSSCRIGAPPRIDVMVESRTGAVAWGLWPTLRFPSPLIKPNVPISGIRLSDSRTAPGSDAPRGLALKAGGRCDGSPSRPPCRSGSAGYWRAGVRAERGIPSAAERLRPAC